MRDSKICRPLRLVDHDVVTRVVLEEGLPRAVGLAFGQSAVERSLRIFGYTHESLLRYAFKLAFAPVEIDGKLLGDGGLSANVPIEAVLFEPIATVFVLDCFARDGKYSPDLETALARKNDLIYGNQTLRALELLMRDRMHTERLSRSA